MSSFNANNSIFLCFEINKAVFGLLEFVILYNAFTAWITKRCEGGTKKTVTADDSKGE